MIGLGCRNLRELERGREDMKKAYGVAYFGWIPVVLSFLYTNQVHNRKHMGTNKSRSCRIAMGYKSPLDYK